MLAILSIIHHIIQIIFRVMSIGFRAVLWKQGFVIPYTHLHLQITKKKKGKQKRKRILKEECEEKKIWLEVKNSSLHFTLATMQM